MFTAKINFPSGGGNAEGAVDAAIDLLSCWYKNGQIITSTWACADRGSTLEAYVTIPESTSLEATNDNKYAERVIDEMLARYHSRPTVVVIGPDPGLPTVCSCEPRSALLLYTDYLTHVPPVRCLDCFLPVPLYRLPHVHDEEHLVILQWAADYRSCDTLQMHCTTGERFGEGQLYRHNSSLSKNGRDLGAKLEALTELPVYYYLHKTRSRGREQELARKCPSCCGEWHLASPLHIFDFQCKTCRLLSAIAADAS